MRRNPALIGTAALLMSAGLLVGCAEGDSPLLMPPSSGGGPETGASAHEAGPGVDAKDEAQEEDPLDLMALLAHAADPLATPTTMATPIPPTAAPTAEAESGDGLGTGDEAMSDAGPDNDDDPTAGTSDAYGTAGDQDTGGASSEPPATAGGDAGWAEPTPMPTAAWRPAATVPPTSTPDPLARAGVPVYFEAPAIGVSATIESVGLTYDNAMDVPKGWANVAWYREGFYPGESGNAVIAGHLDTNTGAPAVFWNLDKLRPGDEVLVTYSSGDRYTFRVEGQQTYPYNAQGSIVESIFGGSITADLNLITCDGAWSHGQATYSHRLVVFTTLEPDKTFRANAN